VGKGPASKKKGTAWCYQKEAIVGAVVFKVLVRKRGLGISQGHLRHPSGGDLTQLYKTLIPLDGERSDVCDGGKLGGGDGRYIMAGLHLSVSKRGRGATGMGGRDHCSYASWGDTGQRHYYPPAGRSRR